MLPVIEYHRTSPMYRQPVFILIEMLTLGRHTHKSLPVNKNSEASHEILSGGNHSNYNLGCVRLFCESVVHDGIE